MAINKHSFYVKPLSDATNEQIASFLNGQGDAAFTSEVQSVEVNGRIITGLYFVPYRLITLLQHSDSHRKYFSVYVKEGNGKVRPYVLHKKSTHRLAATKAVAAVKKKIAALNEV